MNSGNHVEKVFNCFFLGGMGKKLKMGENKRF